MTFLAAAFLLLLLLLVWGAGPALLLTPRRWRCYWVFFVPAFGVALQSAVVWLAARHTTVEGAQAYARISLLLPLLLLAVGIWGRGGGSRVLHDLRRTGGVMLLMAGVLVVLVRPLSQVSDTLTSVSLGSCDAADYAAGARVLGEFARDDRSGFLGHTEVVREQSVDNFFDYWLRLNHFTPSALLALGNATFGWEIHQTVSILAAVLVVAALPLVFWLARALFGLGPWAAWTVALIYGLSPITWYGVWHAALGQSLAAIGIGVLTWAGVTLGRTQVKAGDVLGFAGLMVTGFWILLGSFNFIILICLAPAAAIVVMEAVWRRRWLRLVRWLAAVGVTLSLAGVLFAERVFGLAERFRLFAEHDFGWKIPVLGPAGWLGFVADTNLESFGPAVAWSLAGVFGGLIVLGLWRVGQMNSRRVLVVVGALAPVIAGYAYLQVRARLDGTNESYDAYKVLAVFYPVVLPALCVWLARPAVRTLGLRLIAVGAVALLGASLVRTLLLTTSRVERAPFVVTAELASVTKVESRPEVGSVNMLVDETWSRLWANAFLLRRAQYFQGYTYEGRRGTPLRGEWDLIGGLIEVRTSDGRDGFTLAPGFSLLRVDSPAHVRVAFTDGWYDLEQAPRLAPWRWTTGAAHLLIDNAHPHAQRVSLQLEIGSLSTRELLVRCNDEVVFQTRLEGDPRVVSVPAFSLQPGRNQLSLTSDVPAVQPSPSDTRQLGFIVTRIAIELQVEAAAGR